MGKKSREKGKRGEREFAKLSDGIRIWAEDHDVYAHERPWEVKLLSQGLSVCYNALEEFVAHEQAQDEPEFRPIVAARMDNKPWIVIMYYDDWKAERET